MKRLWQAVRSRLGAGAAVGGAARVRQFDETIQDVTTQLRQAAPTSAVNPRVDKVLQLPVREIVKGRSRLEIRKLANAAFNGEGTAKDEVKATHLWVAAGIQGDAESMYSLAMCFVKGNGLPAPDVERGRTILQELAKQGHGWSAFSLSSLLTREAQVASGQGSADTARRQYRQAFRLCKQAAEAEVAPAYLNLYNMYQEGTGTKRDPVSALAWLKKAAKSGDPQAQAVLAARLAKGDGIRKDEKLGFELYLTSAASGKPQSMYNVACAYVIGNPVPQDYDKAVYYFRQSAEAGFYPAMMNLATMLEMGQAGYVDFDEALRWYEEASKYTEDANPGLERIRQRMSSDEEVKLPGDVTAGAAAAFTERVSEVDGGRGVMYELESSKTNVPTLDVKLDVTDPAEADEVMAEIREAGAVTAAAVMEVLDRRAARGANVIGVTMRDAQGNILAERGGDTATTSSGGGDAATTSSGGGDAATTSGGGGDAATTSGGGGDTKQ